MFALLFVPIAALWAADNHEFLADVTQAPWEYVGVTERAEGAKPNGAHTLPLKVGDHSFILFKQRPLATEQAENGPPKTQEVAASAVH